MRASLALAVAIAVGSGSFAAAQPSERVIFPDHLRLPTPKGIAVSECGPDFVFGGGPDKAGDCLKATDKDAARLKAGVAQGLLASGWIAVSDSEFVLKGAEGCSLVAVIVAADIMRDTNRPDLDEKIKGVVNFFYIPAVPCEALK